MRRAATTTGSPKRLALSAEAWAFRIASTHYIDCLILSTLQHLLSESSNICYSTSVLERPQRRQRGGGRTYHSAGFVLHGVRLPQCFAKVGAFVAMGAGQHMRLCMPSFPCLGRLRLKEVAH